MAQRRMGGVTILEINTANIFLVLMCLAMMAVAIIGVMLIIYKIKMFFVKLFKKG